MGRTTFRPGRWLLGALALGLLFLAFLYWGAVRTPVIREAGVAHPQWPAGKRPVTILFMSDLHVAGPDMPPARLADISAQANGAGADLILIGGDLVSDKRLATRTYPLSEAIAPLAALDAPLGVFATLGNHDHWRDAGEARLQLERAGVRVLDNEVAAVAGFALAGLGDEFTGNDDPAAVRRALDGDARPVIGFGHSPDVFPALDGVVPLFFAGHTHCGQVRLPFVGALATMSSYGDRYACGRRDEDGRTIFTSAGLGTSLLPIRLGARPDMWLVRVGS